MNEDRIKLLVQDCAYKDGIIYFVSKNLNLLFSLDIVSQKITLIDMIPCEEAVIDELCGGVEVVGDKLIILPNITPFIWIYDLRKSKWTQINRKKLPCIGTGGMKQIIKWNNFFYMIGTTYPAIIKMSLNGEQIEYIESPFLDTKIRNNEIKDAFFRTSYAVKDNFAFFASCIDNFVLKFNLDTTEYEWISVGSKECKYSGILWDGFNFWLSPRTTESIVKWDGKDNIKIIPIKKRLLKSINQWNYYTGIHLKGNDIIIPNQEEYESIKINNKDCEKIELINAKYVFMKNNPQIGLIFQNYEGTLNFFFRGISMNININYKIDQLVHFFKNKNSTLLKKKWIYGEKGETPLELYIKLI